MFAFAYRMIRDKYKSLITYSLSGIVFLEMYVAIFPTLDNMSVQLRQMMKTLPPALFKAFNIDPASLNFGNIESLLALKHYSLVWPVMAIIFAISLASYLIINEIDKGTAETLLSLPIKRSKIFVSRYLTGLLLLIGFNAITIFAIVPLTMLHGVDYIWQNNLTLFVGSLFFSWACYSIAIFFSTLFSEKGKSSMASGGIFILSYILSVLAGLKDTFANLKYFSLFNYFNSEVLLIKNTYPDYMFLVLGGVIIVFSVIGYYRFTTRDISS